MGQQKQVPDIAAASTIDMTDTPYEVVRQRLALLFPHVNNHKILGTIENLRILLRESGILCRYNVISKRHETVVPGESFTMDNMESASLACVYSRMKEVLMPTDGYEAYLIKIGDENQYNPVLDWIKSKKWDGISRLPDLYATIQSPENEAKELLIRRWLITAVCMASKNGVDSAGCLVLQGAQGIGKTWWARRLVDEGLADTLVRSASGFEPKDRDSVSQLIRYWIVELGDIGSTFRRSDIDALKNFITDNKDILRRPYGHGDQIYPRRTALIASVDQKIYLHDTAGNRRFWTIPCTAINSYHTVNMQQLWAEVLALVDGGETWRMQPDEKAHVTRLNHEHMQIDPIEEMILQHYQWDNAFVADWKTASQIGKDIGVKNITQRETRIIASAIRKLNGNDEAREKRSMGYKFLVPQPVG